MKKLLTSFFAMLLMIGSLSAQDAPADTAWKTGGVASLGFTNTSLSTYWQAGGINARSFIARVNLFANYKEAKTSWQNDLALEYGAISQGANDNPFIKNADRIELNSKYGYGLTEKLFLSSLLNFRTQFADGFTFDANSPTTIPADTVSDFFAPAYLNFSVGLDYQPNDKLTIYYSPVNSKMTFVGVEEFQPIYNPEGDGFRYELGSLLRVGFKDEIAKNIIFQSTANFFSNYLENPGNIDVNWETITTAKVNDWLAVTFTTNLIYDDDIKFALVDDNGAATGATGPRTQFQNVLAIGLTYQFLK
ncbi:MAG: DUF3078 domain-containing protein [Bacteroidota bacterium]